MGTKQVIVIRKDLKMRRGKEIAQGSHASMAFLTRRLKMAILDDINECRIKVNPVETEWIQESFRKITCKVNSEEELVEIYNRAKSAGLETHLIVDSGRTEFGGKPTKTCLAIGPDVDDRIDEITGDLELY